MNTQRIFNRYERSIQVTAYKKIISAGTESYLNQQFPAHAQSWLLSLPEKIDALAERWKIAFIGHEKNSRFGTILYGKSETYGDVALKIIPWFCPRLKSEIMCYRLLPYREMCPLLDADMEVGALLLKYVHSDKNPSGKESVFSSLLTQRKPADEACSLPLYESVLSEVLDNAEKTVRASEDQKLGIFLESIEKARENIVLFAEDKKYIIHGDAHEYNMIMSEKGCVLIDPLGYIAPYEFEYARYLGTAMKETFLSDKDFLTLSKRVLPETENVRKCLTAFAIDTTLRACNTFIEGNTYEEILFGGGWAKRAWQYLENL